MSVDQVIGSLLTSFGTYELRRASLTRRQRFQRRAVKTEFQLRFPVQELGYWSERYDYDESLVAPIVPAVKRRGFLTEKEFLAVCKWKTPRSQPRCRTNSPDFIREVTKCGLSSSVERLRIEVLTLLNGVSWPTASVILHFFHVDPYPILDFRALWSLRNNVPQQYGFDFWQKYTSYCRDLSKRTGVSMRILDRGLWQYSKENQR
jgi:hypothetical protein